MAPSYQSNSGGTALPRDEMSAFEKNIFAATCANCRKCGTRPATLVFKTLFLFALILALAMSSSMSGVTSSVGELGQQVDELKKVVDQQTSEIRTLRAALEPSPSRRASPAR